MPDFPDYTRAILLLGDAEGSLTPVNVDVDGSLYALLQGEYLGEKRTVALNEQGSMSAFVVDSVDVWEQIVAVGNAELAARLGSSVVYERRGQMFLQDSFQYGIRWRKELAGTGAGVDLDAETWYLNGYSAKLISGSDGGVQHSALELEFGAIPSGKVGVSCAFVLPTKVESFRLNIGWYDGATAHAGVWRYDDASDKLQVYVQPNTWADVATDVQFKHGARVWHYAKVVIDTENDIYLRAFFDDTEYDLSAHSLNLPAVASDPSWYAAIWNYGRAGQNDLAYVDAVILTIAEPE